MIAERSFANTAADVTNARRFVVETLRDVDPESAARAAVMVSELATNSFRHAASRFVVRIEQFADEVRVSVEDTGPGTPAVQSPSPSDSTGRGLQIVAALSTRWGVVPTVDGLGKRVWFTIGTRGRPGKVQDDTTSTGTRGQTAAASDTRRPPDGRPRFQVSASGREPRAA
jgi:hypothetical protein